MKVSLRFPAFTVLLAALCTCDGSTASKDAPSRSRYEAVEAEKKEVVGVEQFCEPWLAEGDAKPFAYPPLTAAAPSASGARWINVWATWCKPCIEELPRIAAWQKELGVKLELLAVDGDPAAVAKFKQEHPEVASTLEIKDSAEVEPWLGSLGLPEASVLPLHFFLDGRDRLRCVRSAGLSPRDRDALVHVLGEVGAHR